MFDEESFEQRYRATDALWSGRPNAQLVREAADLPAGAALDVGCGEGADAVWLAERGWRVAAVDFSTTALQRGAARAAAAGEEVAGRIDWRHADVTRWVPEAGVFDLVSAQYMHLPTDQREPLFARLAAAVGAGGTLLVVGHDLVDHPSDGHQPPDLGRFFTAEDVAGGLDPAAWEVLVAESRPGAPREGHDAVVSDTVLRARKRR